jgi:hypothetical protein
MWITGYNEEVVKDKLRSGLSKDLAKEWSRVHTKLETVNAQIALLRDMGYTAEDYERLEARRKDKNRDREPDTSRHRSNRRPDKSRKGKPSDRKDREFSNRRGGRGMCRGWGALELPQAPSFAALSRPGAPLWLPGQ